VSFNDLAQREAAKRERCYDQRQRWRILQEMITWIDARQPVPRNSRQSCLARQAAILARMNNSQSKKQSEK